MYWESLLRGRSGSVMRDILIPETTYGCWHHKDLLDKRGAEIIQTDACVYGGINE